MNKLQEKPVANNSVMDSEQIAQQGHFAYDAVSSIDRSHFWYVVRNERILALFQNSYADWQNSSFMELGSGAGNVIGYLSEHGVKDVTGCELNPYGIEKCKQRFPSIPVIQSDLLTLKDKTDKHFDGIGLFDCLEHIEDDRKALLEAKEYLKAGGKIFLTVPAHSWLWSRMDEMYGHHRRYTRQTLSKVLESAGFKNIQVRYMMAPLLPLLILRIFLSSFIPKNLTAAESAKILSDEVQLPPLFINETLLAILRIELHLFGMNDLNFGGSLIAVASV